MKLLQLFLVLFVVCLVLSAVAYFQGHEGLATLFLLMSLASALNASHPKASKPASKSIERTAPWI